MCRCEWPGVRMFHRSPLPESRSCSSWRTSTAYQVSINYIIHNALTFWYYIKWFYALTWPFTIWTFWIIWISIAKLTLINNKINNYLTRRWRIRWRGNSVHHRRRLHRRLSWRIVRRNHLDRRLIRIVARRRSYCRHWVVRYRITTDVIS